MTLLNLNTSAKQVDLRLDRDDLRMISRALETRVDREEKRVEGILERMTDLCADAEIDDAIAERYAHLERLRENAVEVWDTTEKELDLINALLLALSRC